jgi:hypothetical protein
VEAALCVSTEHLVPVQFKKGEQVWLEGCNLKTHHPTIKLAPHQYGPFKVTIKLSPITYHLTLPSSIKVHPVFHIDLLTRYHKTDAHGPNYECPTPDIIDGKPEWEVEKIMKSQLFSQHQELQLLI